MTIYLLISDLIHDDIQKINCIHKYQINTNCNAYDSMDTCIECFVMTKTEATKCDIGINVECDEHKELMFITGFRIDRNTNMREQHKHTVPILHGISISMIRSYLEDIYNHLWNYPSR